MHKLYQKNEILFAVLWIVVYVVGASAADVLSGMLGVEKLITCILHGALTALLLAWIHRHGLARKYGLCAPACSAKAFLYYLPLAVICSCNFWGSLAMNLSPAESLLYVLSMLLVGVLEEIIFRGLLFRAMQPDGLRSAVIVSSVTFGIGHLVNLVNGSGAELIPNLCQVAYAVAFGFLFVVIFLKSGSLLPCIAVHSVVNATSVFAAQPSTTHTIVSSLVLCALAVGYTLVLLRTLPRTQTH